MAVAKRSPQVSDHSASITSHVGTTMGPPQSILKATKALRAGKAAKAAKVAKAREQREAVGVDPVEDALALETPNTALEIGN
jgi:hypothetical protein